jgi:phosphonate transport system permease protein
MTLYEQKLKEQPKSWMNYTIGAVIVLALVIWSLDVFKFTGVMERGVKIAKLTFLALLNPDTELLFSLKSTGVPALLLETVAIAFLGTIIGSVLAIPFAFFSSKNMFKRFVTIPGITTITFIRTFPVFILGLMFIRVTGPGAFAGVLTMSVSSIGMISKLYIEAIEGIDGGIIEFLDSAGCSKFEKIRYGIIPQLFTNFASITIYRFEINVKNASILGLVGAGGIGYPLIAAMQNNRWNDASAYLLGLIFMVILIESFSTRVRKRLSYGE